MFDAAAVSSLLSGTTAGWTLVALVLVTLIRVWPLIKAKVTEARASNASIESDQWKRLIDWNQRLQDECENCHRERDEWRARALKAEAASEGIGMVRTAQAIADAEKRQADRGGKTNEQ